MSLRLATALLLAIAVFLGAIGPFGTTSEPILRRLAFWLVVAPIGGMITISLARAFRLPKVSEPTRIIAAAALATFPNVAIVLLAMYGVLRHNHGLMAPVVANLMWQVFAINLAVAGVTWLAERSHTVRVRTVLAPPLPEKEAEFRKRLSAKHRYARLLALEAHDHYVRVHTDSGSELLSLRFSDAVREVERIHGYRVHRSWWIAAPAIKKASWKRGRGSLELDTGLLVPISRSGAPILREAGWL